MRTMASRERFLTSICGGVPDRFFRYEHGPWPTTRERWLREGLSPETPFAEAFAMDPLCRFGINSGYCDSPYEPKFEETTLEETESCRVYRDSDGIVKRVLRQDTDTSMPQFLSFPVAGRDGWRRIVHRLDPADAPARIGDPDRLRRQCADPDVATLLPLCGAFGHPRNLLGDEGLAYLIFDDPRLLEEILENWRELYCELLRQLTAVVRVDAILIWEDMCFRGGPLLSPDHFRRFMLQPYHAVIETARGCGVQAVIVDTDGDCRKMIPVFLDAGVDCLMPFEVQAGMDVVAIRNAYPGLAIMGGIDKRALAADRATVEAEVDRVLPHFVGAGGYLPTLDHTVPPDVPLEHFTYYLECVRRYE